MRSVVTYADEDDFWVDLGTGPTPAEVRVRFTMPKHGPARAFLVFRGEAEAWVAAHGERYRAQIGGPDADRVRLIPDPEGPFKCFRNGTVLQVGLRHVSVWPCERRALVDCTWVRETAREALVVEMPKGFARPNGAPPTALRSAGYSALVDPEPPPPPPKREPMPALPLSTEVVRRGPGRPPKVVDAILGTPPPGRSALDQRRAEGR